uniref:N/A n=1 Tax=Ganoderma boninense TaxID=34458 RepID=A0A5K1JZC4_9APHY|nr:N/A [Ganoderma boninense]
MIITVQDAVVVFDIGEDDDDVLNELNISENGKHLAFSSDSGAVGIVDLASKVITRMKNRHTTVCGSVKFIPDRPSEIGNILSRYDISRCKSTVHAMLIAQWYIFLNAAAPTPSEGATVSLSPPFVHSLSVSPSGLIVIGTADGRVWLGGGGEKRPDGKKKRSRKWEGLREDEGIWLQVADGPVVSAAFTHADRFLTCSLLGVLTEYSISRDADGELVATKSWTTVTKALEKVNAMAADQSRILVGGFTKEGKGVVEVWQTVGHSL